VIVSDPSRSNLFGRAYSKSFARKIVLKVGLFLQAVDEANAAGGVWANPKWALLPYQGAAGKKTEKTTYICASSQKVRTYVRTSFFFSAFLGVSRQEGSSKTREKIEYVSKTITGISAS
jgi:hypothetical protein